MKIMQLNTNFVVCILLIHLSAQWVDAGVFRITREIIEAHGVSIQNGNIEENKIGDTATTKDVDSLMSTTNVIFTTIPTTTTGIIPTTTTNSPTTNINLPTTATNPPITTNSPTTTTITPNEIITTTLSERINTTTKEEETTTTPTSETVPSTTTTLSLTTKLTTTTEKRDDNLTTTTQKNIPTLTTFTSTTTTEADMLTTSSTTVKYETPAMTTTEVPSYNLPTTQKTLEKESAPSTTTENVEVSVTTSTEAELTTTVNTTTEEVSTTSSKSPIETEGPSTTLADETNLSKSTEPTSTTSYDTTTVPSLTSPSVLLTKQNRNLEDVSINEVRPKPTLPVPSEKRGKFMKDNTTNINDLNLPLSADVWTLAGLKPMKKEKHVANANETVTKNLSDWSKIMKEVDVFNETAALSQSKTNSIETEDEKPLKFKILTSPFPNKTEDFESPLNMSTLAPSIADMEIMQPLKIQDSAPSLNNILNETVEITADTNTPPSINKATTERTENNQIIDDVQKVLHKHVLTPVANLTTTNTNIPSTTTETNELPKNYDPDKELTKEMKEKEEEKDVDNEEENKITTEMSDSVQTTQVIVVSTRESAVESESGNINLTVYSNEEQFEDSGEIELTTTYVDFSSNTAKEINRMVETTIAPEEDFPSPPKIETNFILNPTFDDFGRIDPKSSGADYNVIIAATVSVVGIVALILLVGFLYVMRKRQKQTTYGQRCRPVGLDAYSLDNVSVGNSMRRKGGIGPLRQSKRSYGNIAFDDPSLKHNVLRAQDLSKFMERKSNVYEEFKDVPQIIARADEVPQGCEDLNRYANVIPLPETRVILEQTNGDEKSEYINANFVRGPKDQPNYYIATQGPLESTVINFWRMIWEQNSRVIIMATDLIENGIEKCTEYLPPSVTLDNHTVHGDFQITLKNREVKEKYAVSTVLVKNTTTDTSREITHFWYQWPEVGVPSEEASLIAMLLEARSSLKIYASELNETKSGESGDAESLEKNKMAKNQGPFTIHCSNGTGRTGTIIACDIAIRSLETPKRSVDIPQIAYYVRRGRASAIQTKEQYEFIYRVTNMYANKITAPLNDN